mmetsp:Transcript_6732/g.15317  ORF Transcript_6732/g.15317 Transcript_6732/m.15317 type:complete len:321 (+) Transcript_6732:718-1680(+)
MCFRLLLGELLLRHHDVCIRILRERERHPEVRVAVHLRLVTGKFRGELLEKHRDQIGAHRERAKAGSDELHGAEPLKQLHRHVVGNLLHLSGVAFIIHGDESVCVESLRLPVVRAGHGPKLREDVRVVASRRVVPGTRHEHLVAPEDGDATGPQGRVNARLLHHRLEDREALLLAVHRHDARQLHARLVVVLRAGQRREARSLTRGVVHAHGSSVGEQFLDVDVLRLLCHLARLVEGVERSETVARAVTGPVFVNGEDDRVLLRRLPSRCLEALLPVRCLCLLRRAHDDDVKTLRAVHLCDLLQQRRLACERRWGWCRHC